jgi:dipeptidyl-peptidase-4
MNGEQLSSLINESRVKLRLHPSGRLGRNHKAPKYYIWHSRNTMKQHLHFRPAQLAIFALTLAFFFFSRPERADGQKLNIEESVLGQFAQFAPERVNQWMWVEGSDAWSHVKNDTLRVNDRTGKETLILPLSILNAQSQLEMKRFPGIEWLSPGKFRFASGDFYYTYDFKRKSATPEISGAEEDNATLAPGGNRVAYTRANNLYVNLGDRSVQLTDLPEGVVAGQSIARNEFGISGGIFWSTQGSAIAFYEKDERNVSSYPLVDYSKVPALHTPIRYPMAGQDSEHAALGIYNIASGKTSYLNVNNGLRDDSYYITNVAWTPDDAAILAAIISRDQRTSQLIRFNATTGEQERILFTETDSKYIEPEQAPHFIPDGSGRFLWFSEREGFNNLYLYNSDGKLMGKTNFTFPLDALLGFDAKNQYVVVTGTGANATEHHAFKVSLSDFSSTQITRQPGTHNVQLSSDGTRLLDQWSSLTVPNRAEVLQVNGKIERVVLNSDDPLAARTIGKTEVKTIKAKDGTDLWCRVITPPKMEKNKRYPVLVYVYNGPHVQLVTDSYLAGAPLWMHSLAGDGFVVFTVDGRGSANRGKDFEQAIFRQLGDLEMQDQLDGVAYLKSLPYVDPNRMAVHGWSYGGFMTTSLMLRHPDVFKIGVAGGPVIDWSFYEVMYTERYMDDPQSNSQGFEKAKLTNYVDQLQGDLLMIHGTDDDVVVIQHNMAFLTACIQKGVQVDFFAYPRHAHNVRGKDRVHLMKNVIGYIMDRI